MRIHPRTGEADSKQEQVRPGGLLPLEVQGLGGDAWLEARLAVEDVEKIILLPAQCTSWTRRSQDRRGLIFPHPSFYQAKPWLVQTT